MSLMILILILERIVALLLLMNGEFNSRTSFWFFMLVPGSITCLIVFLTLYNVFQFIRSKHREIIEFIVQSYNRLK